MKLLIMGINQTAIMGHLLPHYVNIMPVCHSQPAAIVLCGWRIPANVAPVIEPAPNSSVWRRSRGRHRTVASLRPLKFISLSLSLALLVAEC